MKRQPYLPRTVAERPEWFANYAPLANADWREYGKSGGDSEELLKNLPSGATVKVKIIALNGSLAAADGPVAEIVVT